MSADHCPICSGEIQTFRRSARGTGPSGIKICQCCGSRLRRVRGIPLVLGLLGLAVLGAAFLLTLLAGRALVATGLAVGLILLLVGAFALVTRWLRGLGWVALDDPLA